MTQDLRKKCATLILTCLFVTVSSASVRGQSGSTRIVPQQKNAPTVSDQLLKDYELALIEVEKLRNQVAGKDEIIRLKDEEIAARKAIDDINRQRIQALLDAVKERTTANALDDRRVALFEQSLTEFKAELLRVRNERDSARRRNKFFAVGGFILGALAIGYLKK